MDSMTQENMMAKAQQIWTMLDEMAENNPQAYRKFIDKQKQESVEWTTPPATHMCVQTLMYEPKQQRVFINFCGWLRVHGPKDDEAPIPMVGGPLSEDEDENGTYSIVTLGFNPKVLEDFGRDAENPEELKAMVNLAISFVQDSHKVALSRNYTILKRSIKCKGTEEAAIKALKSVFKKSDSEAEKQMEDLKKGFAPMQALNRDEILSNITGNGAQKDNGSGLTMPGAAYLQKEPEIKLTTEGKPKKPGLIQEISNHDVVLPQPKYSLDVRDPEGEKVRRIVVRFELPGVSSVKECDLDISEDDLTLSVKDRYWTCLPFPEKVRDEDASAKFSTRSSSLTVTVPTVKAS